MDFNKHFLPVIILGAIGATYYYSKNYGGNNAATVPNPASGGVTGPSTQPAIGVQTDVTPVYYDAKTWDQNPSQNQVISNPYAAFPGSPLQTPPTYLAFNFGPSHDLTKQAAVLNQQNPADATNAYIDGTGDTLLSSSRSRQVSNDPNWIDSAIQNINNFLSMESGYTSPSLTSLTQSGSLN